jgi:hypothetical protein
MNDLYRYIYALAPWAIICVALSACVPSIVNIRDAPVKANGPNITDEDVKQAVIRAGQSLGWTMQNETPRRLVASQTVSDKTAVVAVDYNTKTYSINYRDSTNLGYEWGAIRDYGGTITNPSTGQGLINKKYNEWVKKLDAAIQVEISQLR